MIGAGSEVGGVQWQLADSFVILSRCIRACCTDTDAFVYRACTVIYNKFLKWGSLLADVVE